MFTTFINKLAMKSSAAISARGTLVNSVRTIGKYEEQFVNSLKVE